MLFRSSDFSRRRKFVQLTEDVKKFGAEVAIFSSMHESGERKSAILRSDRVFVAKACLAELNQLTGIAALLTYPLDIELVLEEEKGEQTGDETTAGVKGGA